MRNDLYQWFHETISKVFQNTIIEILDSLLAKGETKDELAGGIFILREKASSL